MHSWDFKIVEVTIPADLSPNGKEFKKLMPIDKCIADLVQALEDANIKMRGSCCGHGEREGDIDLQDGRILIIKHNGEKYLAER